MECMDTDGLVALANKGYTKSICELMKREVPLLVKEGCPEEWLEKNASALAVFVCDFVNLGIALSSLEVKEKVGEVLKRNGKVKEG